MSNRKLIYAVIPARSGSKGFPDKNIKQIGGIPLIGHSIKFAKRIPGVNKVLCSTDSERYAELAVELGAEVPFLRSDYASSDTAMEQDILIDLRDKLKVHNIPEPDMVVWLRPTFVFRNLNDVNKCIDAMISDSNITACRTVVRAENRLYRLENGRLLPNFDDKGRSMIRRQEVMPSFKVYSTDVFKFKNNNFGDNFLGQNIIGVETSQICGLDIDDEFDFNIVSKIYMEQRKYE